jgi:hypothetical protein
MVEYVVTVLLFVEEFINFIDVLPNLGDVERSEILEKSLVSEVLGIREECTLSILKKKAFGTSFGGLTSARYKNFST